MKYTSLEKSICLLLHYLHWLWSNCKTVHYQYPRRTPLVIVYLFFYTYGYVYNFHFNCQCTSYETKVLTIFLKHSHYSLELISIDLINMSSFSAAPHIFPGRSVMKKIPELEFQFSGRLGMRDNDSISTWEKQALCSALITYWRREEGGGRREEAGRVQSPSGRDIHENVKVKQIKCTKRLARPQRSNRC